MIARRPPNICLFALCALLQPIASQQYASPLVFQASTSWHGNDGPWSYFTLNLGDGANAQEVSVFPAVTVNSIFVVSDQGCLGTGFPGGTSSCTSSRGGVYARNRSSTWESTGSFNLTLGQELGYNSINASLGRETIGITTNSGNIFVSNCTIAPFASDELWFGLMGLSPVTVGTLSPSNSTPSFFESLQSPNRIAGRSWGYTAGASYHRFRGSLILGGYDSTLFWPNTTLKMALQNGSTNPFVVGVKGISSRNVLNSSDTLVTLSSNYLSVKIEPELPYIWLPKEVCDAFAKVFQLTWNSTVGLYLIQESLDKQLRGLNPAIVFTVCESENGACSDISFDYAAFALKATYPLIPGSDDLLYFPIKQANNFEQYTFGRAFLQATYLFADFDRGYFNISQTNFSTGSQQLVTVAAPGAPTVSPTGSPIPTSSQGSGSTGIRAGAIAGLVVAVVAVLLICGYAWQARRSRFWPFRPRPVPPEQSHSAAELGGGTRLEMEAANTPKQFPAAALAASPPVSSNAELTGSAPAPRSAEMAGSIPLYELPAESTRIA